MTNNQRSSFDVQVLFKAFVKPTKHVRIFRDRPRVCIRSVRVNTEFRSKILIYSGQIGDRCVTSYRSLEMELFMRIYTHFSQSRSLLVDILPHRGSGR
jgi:hypothetical protein